MKLIAAANPKRKRKAKKRKVAKKRRTVKRKAVKRKVKIKRKSVKRKIARKRKKVDKKRVTSKNKKRKVVKNTMAKKRKKKRSKSKKKSKGKRKNPMAIVNKITKGKVIGDMSIKDLVIPTIAATSGFASNVGIKSFVTGFIPNYTTMPLPLRVAIDTGIAIASTMILTAGLKVVPIKGLPKTKIAASFGTGMLVNVALDGLTEAGVIKFLTVPSRTSIPASTTEQSALVSRTVRNTRYRGQGAGIFKANKQLV